MKKIQKIKFSGTAITRSVYDGTSQLKWCIRENPKNALDSGWIFIGDLDDEKYLANRKNWCIATYAKVIEIETAILEIYSMLIGTELTLIVKDGKRHFVNTNTNKPI